jgi:3-oxoacyl-[acyl-carrier protein] reductase
MDLALAGKRVLVTGSSKGIGKAIANRFSDEGAKVVINGRTSDSLEDTRRELLREGANVIAFCGDIQDEKDNRRLKQFIQSSFGGLDHLVLNVGSGKGLTKDRLDVSEWRRLIDINLLGAINVLHNLQELISTEASSSIVFVSSIAAKEYSAAPSAYVAAKASIITLAKALSREFAKHKIRVNCVLPGNIAFPGGRWEEISKENPDMVKAMLEGNVPMKRFGTPGEIADSVVFLASERSSFTTGATLVVDGGQTVTW